MLTGCNQSLLFWVNAFGWSYRQRVVNEQGEVLPTQGHRSHVPMITWPVQDEVLSELDAALFAGQDCNLKKCRDMGATWLVLYLFDWHFLFHHDMNFGVVSRKQELVDAPGDMDSLFEKLRYVHNHLPSWMKPPIKSRYMHLQNKETRSTLAGESTNSNVGRGGRKTAYLVDEAAAIENGEEIEASLSQTTSCQIWVSTSKGPGTQFYRREHEKRGKMMFMPWYRHPDKAQGAKEVYEANGRIIWTSPWLERERARMSSRSFAREIMMDDGQAGDTFFDIEELSRHRRDHVRAPMLIGELRLLVGETETDKEEFLKGPAKNKGDNAALIQTPAGKWRFWAPLVNGRPPQEHWYLFGADISNGAGNSNSVLSVMAGDTGEIVAKWWDANASPEQFAILAALAGHWFGGRSAPAFIVWENNGPGGIFGRKLVKLKYPHCYLQRIDNTRSERRTDRWGWHSNKERKEVLFGMYRDALAADRCINHCAESLDEASDYIYDDSGLLVPARTREETGGGRELHGDHCVADALLVLGQEEMPRQRGLVDRPPPGTYAHRVKERRDARRRAEEQL
ncbi:MAG: hypothetical protein IT443_11840 [Phycisphaeraceae bacterium]|nr:hypothetical protein [Phycisphaeraceae bacterium]